MRVRHRSTGQTSSDRGYIGFAVDLWYGSTITTDHRVHDSIPSGDDTISDFTGYGWHDCTHTRRSARYADSPVSVNFGFFGSDTRYVHSAVLHRLSDPDYGTWIPELPPSLGESDVADEIESKLYSLLDEKFDLTSSVLDLTDLLSPLKSISTLVKSVTKRDLHRSIKDLAGSHLSVKYGVFPTISDVKMLLSFREKLRKKIMYLQHTGGRQILRAQRVLNVPVNQDSLDTTSSHVVMTAMQPVHLKFGVTGISAFDAFTSYCGLNRPLETVWERIPFSFVVDWIVNVGQVVSQVQDLLCDKQWEVDGPLLFSSKRVTTREKKDKWTAGTMVYCGNCWRSLVSDVIVPSYASRSQEYRRYSSKLGIASFSLGRGSGLSRHLLEVASLIAQRLL